MELKLAWTLLAVVGQLTLQIVVGWPLRTDTTDQVDVSKQTGLEELEDIVKGVSVSSKQQVRGSLEDEETGVDDRVLVSEEDQDSDRYPHINSESVNTAAATKSSKLGGQRGVLRSPREAKARKVSDKDLRRHRLFLFQKPLLDLAELEGEAQDGDELLFDQGLTSLREALVQGQEEAHAIKQALNNLLETMAVDRQRRESNKDKVVHGELVGNHQSTLSSYSREKEQKKDLKSNFVVKKNNLLDASVVLDVHERSLPKLPDVVAMETLQPAVQGEDVSERSLDIASRTTMQ